MVFRVKKLLERIQLSHKVTVLVVVPLLFELVFIVVLSQLLMNAELEVFKEGHARYVITRANEIPRVFYDAGSLLGTFALTKSEIFDKQYRRIMEKIPGELRTLEILVHANPRQQAIYQRVQEAASEGLEILQATRSGFDRDKLDIMTIGDATGRRARIQMTLDNLMGTIRELTDEERKVLALAPAAQVRNRQLLLACLAGGMVVNVVLAGGLAIFIYTGMTRRLAVLMDNTARLSKGDDLNPPVSGADEISQLDRVFHKMAEELDAAARHKQELISMVSHDLRTPLTAVSVSLELVGSGALGSISEKLDSELGVARRNTRRLIELINDLLDIEKLEAGRLEMFQEMHSLVDLLEPAIEAVQAVAEKRSIDIICPETEAMVFADKRRIVQVLVNLLGNAVNFSPDHSRIHIGIESGDDSTEVMVIDQGPGIPESEQEHIFERFSQVDERGVERQSAGTGLGLAICHAIMVSHDGEIGVSSTEGEGSTFWFRLPHKSD